MTEYQMNVLNVAGLPLGLELIGLMRGGKHEGYGDFCGWYAVEKMLDCTLLAAFVTDTPHGKGGYLEKDRVECFVIEDPKPVDVGIYSCFVARYLEADDDQEAIRIFLWEDADSASSVDIASLSSYDFWKRRPLRKG